jgi:hypothetical protein
MKLLLSCNICIAVLFASGSYKEGTLLESAGSYVCVEAQAPDRILIAAARKPTDLKALKGKAVLIKYDDEYVWLRPPHGRAVRLRQDYLTRAFTAGSPCEEVVESAWKRLNAPPKKLLVRESH